MPNILGIDTAISNTGMAVIDLEGRLLDLLKPIPKKTTEVFPHQWAKIDRVMEAFERLLSRHQPLVVGFEDYLVGGNQQATTAVTAELVGAIRYRCINYESFYCRVHPTKTLKFVRKARKVTKTEIRDFAREHLGLTKQVLKDAKIDPSDESDIADALVIANIARLAYSVRVMIVENNVSPGYAVDRIAEEMKWPDRWKEIMVYTGSGIFEKPGLFV